MPKDMKVVCMECGNKFEEKSHASTTECPKCGSGDIRA